MRTTFDNELKTLKESLMYMHHQVDATLALTIKLIEKNDAKIAETILTQESLIYEEEKHIESLCFSAMLMQAPVASDLRNIQSSIKVVHDLNRIANHCSDIASLLLETKSLIDENLSLTILKMATLTKIMENESMQAFFNVDVKLAMNTRNMDNEIDDLYLKVKADIQQELESKKYNSEILMTILMISKYYERIGDKIEHICDWIEFDKSGSYNNKRLL